MDCTQFGKTMNQLQQRFRTPRLLLTRIAREDLDDMHTLHSEPQLARVLGAEPEREKISILVDNLADQWDCHGFGWWAMREPASGRFIGRGGLRRVSVDGVPEVELGYALLPEFWNRGLATELSRVSIAQGFVRLGLSDIVGLALPGNHGSRRVMEKTGMHYERDVTHAGQPHVLYRLTAASWRTGAPAPARDGHTARELVAG